MILKWIIFMFLSLSFSITWQSKRLLIMLPPTGWMMLRCTRTTKSMWTMSQFMWCKCSNSVNKCSPPHCKSASCGYWVPDSGGRTKPEHRESHSQCRWHLYAAASICLLCKTWPCRKWRISQYRDIDSLKMTGLGPDMSALNLLSQANLNTVLNKVSTTPR